jgi:hypothetical protein
MDKPEQSLSYLLSSLAIAVEQQKPWYISQFTFIQLHKMRNLLPISGCHQYGLAAFKDNAHLVCLNHMQQKMAGIYRTILCYELVQNSP